MKITLTSTGGFAAGIRRPPRVLESASISEQAAVELERLVAVAKLASEGKEAHPGHARDTMSYTITVEEEGAKKTVLSQSDTTMSPSFAALLQCLERHLASK